MKLLWEDLKFWNKKQILIIKRLDEDYKKMSNLSYIKKLSIWDISDKINYIEKLNMENFSVWTSKHVKELNKTKIKNIFDWIILPILESNKINYEQNFDMTLRQKKKLELDKLRKKY